ncbi:MAG: nitroreductase family deazaflavin-dependent oxidoreductase [Actinomycetia bacterium]|nr:nitroreductase family deazaflavin-dependent oxidoreductase [Actinomycetes bacterium]MCP4222374.1 nitroreductase family deazaflavin-dependent oxidoreductase [Actinomycetes bacterium]MCP5030240.1 nitroreductase family deazaflavin-dependent oxidoreductase [Actinomycetes bacterium]
MSIQGEYGPSTWDWVNDQVEEYEGSAGAKGNTLRDTGLPIIVMTTVGHKSGKVRKVPLMRVEHEGEYAIVASKGGAPEHPGWYHNLMADPNVMIQDGPEPFDAVVRLISGAEREQWWERSVAAFSPYADYKVKAAEVDRVIPVFIASPAS